MKPLWVLLASFVAALLATKAISGKFDLAFSARIALSVMLLFTAIGHFVYTRGMALMMPDFIPYKTAFVYGTGIIEILAAVGLQVPALQFLTGCLLIVFFIVLLPANIHAARKHIDYQKGTTNGPGLQYLWFRVPLQLLFICWAYFSAVQPFSN